MMAYKIFDAMRTGIPMPLFNGGNMSRDWTFVDDIVSGVVAFFLLGEPFGPLKLAGAALALSGLVLARRGTATQAKGSGARSGSIQASRAASP